MSFSIVGSVNHLVAEYRRFLLSTYRLADKRLRDQFEEHIRQADVLVKGPYVTLANDFARENTLRQLDDQGVGHKDLQRLNWSFGDKEEGQEDGGTKKRRSRRSHAKSRLKLLPAFVCHQTGRVYGEMPEGAAASTVTIQQVMRGRGNTCPVCNSTYTKGDILTLLRSGAASSNSVLATHHLDRLPVKERKLLVFADNRQEAAHQAGYMGDRHRQFAVRHAIERVVQDAGAGSGGISLNVIAHRLLEVFQDMDLARRRLSTDEQKCWRKALELEAAGEFCRATHQRISLENLALVEVQYEFLDQLEDDTRFKEACEHVGLKVRDENPDETGRASRAQVLDKRQRGGHRQTAAHHPHALHRLRDL